MHIALGILAALLISGAAQESSDKQLLRYKLRQGDKVRFKLDQKMKFTFEQIPEEFSEMMGKEPFNLHLKATLALEVTEVAKDGTALLKGRFQTARATGTVLVEKVDFTYDAKKPLTEKEEEGGGDNAFGIDPTALLRRMVKQEVKLRVDPRGRVKVEGGDARGAGPLQLFNLNGLMGEYPEKKVGVGDTWETKQTIGIPNVPQLKVNLRAKNKVEKFSRREGMHHAHISSTFRVATVADEARGDGQEEGMFNLQAKMTGKGTGRSMVDVMGGGPVRGQNSVDVKITAKMANPQGGDDLEFKATLKLEQKTEMGK